MRNWRHCKAFLILEKGAEKQEKTPFIVEKSRFLTALLDFSPFFFEKMRVSTFFFVDVVIFGRLN